MEKSGAKPKKPEWLVERVFPHGDDSRFVVSLGVARDKTYRYYLAPSFGATFSEMEEAEYEHAGEKYAPPSIPGCLKLPPAPLVCTDPAALFFRIQRLILRELDVTDEGARTITAFTLFTWIGDNLPAQPVLFILGKPGSGKSRLGDLLFALCRRPARFTLNSSFAAARNVIHRFEPTLILEEATPRGRGNEKDAEWVRAICDAASNRDGMILMADREMQGEFHEYRFGSPKAIFSTGPWQDEAFNRRTVVIQMRTTAKNFKPRFQKGFEQEAEAITAELHFLRLRLLGVGAGDPADLLDTVNDDLFAARLGPGAKQFGAALAAVIKFVAPLEYQAHLRTVSEAALEKVAEKAESFPGRVVAVVARLHSRGGGLSFAPAEIAEMLNAEDPAESARNPVKPAGVGRVLAILGFKAAHTRERQLREAASKESLETLFREYLPDHAEKAIPLARAVIVNPNRTLVETPSLGPVDVVAPPLSVTAPRPPLYVREIAQLAAQGSTKADIVASLGPGAEKMLTTLLRDGRLLEGPDGRLEVGRR